MSQPTKKRGENWSSEEKEILRHIIAASSKILEDKSTKSNINLLKAKEWKNVTIQFNEITAKNRSEAELKLAWKRMKLAAKANISSYNREQHRTGGGGKPPSPSQEDLEVMAIAPHDFEDEHNDYDSDALLVQSTPQYEDAIAGPSRAEQPTYPFDSTDDIELVIPETKRDKTDQRDSKKRKEHTKQDIIDSNVNFKKRNLEMLEIEHKFTIEIAKLKIQLTKNKHNMFHFFMLTILK